METSSIILVDHTVRFGNGLKQRYDDITLLTISSRKTKFFQNSEFTIKKNTCIMFHTYIILVLQYDVKQI